jgi:multidrug efflux pump subunit AcrB
MWIVRIALRRPYTVATFCIVIAIMGWLSIARMKVDVLPTVDIPVVVVVWNYPGMSAEDAEKRIALPAERGYSTTVGGISRMESQSIPGLVILKLYFEEGTDVGGAIAQVSSVSQTITRIMPPGIQPPIIVRHNASNIPVAQLTVSGDGVSEQQLYDYGINFLRLRLFMIPGLSTPAPYGGRARQITVDLDPARAAANGVSPQDVVEAVLQSNVIIPAGSIRLGQGDYDVQLNSSPTAVAEFDDLPLKQVDGRSVLLRDVARVRDGFAVQSNMVHVNGKRATYLSLLKKADASTLAVVEAARELLPTLQATAPEGVELKLEFDQSVFVRSAIVGVLEETALAAGLVSLLTLFFLGSWRSTLVVVTSIPLSMLLGIGALYLSGQTLNLMTLGGLSLAVGMLVDDATVEVENIHRNRLLGKNLTQAILDGARQIAVPALAATLTICIVFFPVVLLDGPARFLFTPLALAVVFSMLASYLLSRTVVPALSHKLMAREALHASPDTPSGELSGRGFNAWRDRQFGKLQAAYGSLLELVLARKGPVLGATLALLAIGGLLVPVIGFDFFPTVDTGQMRLHFRGPPGMRIEETERMVLEAEQEIRSIIPERELAAIHDNIGLPVFFNLAFVQTDNVGSQDADILIALGPGHAPTRDYMGRIREQLTNKFPNASLYFQPADIVSQVLSFGLPAPLDIQIEGRDQATSAELARRMLRSVRRIPGVSDVRLAQVSTRPALRVEVDRQRASLLGLTERDVANDLITSLSSSALMSPSFWISPVNGVNYPVVVQTPIERLRSVDALMTTPLRASVPSLDAPGGTDSLGTYLGSIASLEHVQARGSVNHYAVQPVLNVQASVTDRDLGSVANDIQEQIGAESKNLPKGTAVRLRGQSESMFTAFESLGLGLLLAVVLVYLLLVVLFQSWLDPFIIILAVPGAFLGTLWMLALTGTTLNVSSFMGTIMSVGIAVSNSILLVSFANEVRAERGLSAAAAALVAGKTRLRPVLMTALAMIFGMLPMAFGGSEGGEQNAPLGRAVIGGLLAATAVTLIIVPVAYAILRRLTVDQAQLDRKFEADSIGEGSHGL